MVAILLALLIPVFFMFDGYVLQQLWGWFITPVFHLPVPALAYAVGLCLVASFLTHQRVENESRGGEHEAAKHMVMFPSFVLLLGFIIKQFV